MPHAGTFLSICFQPEDQSGRKTRNIILTSRPHSSIRGGYQPGVLRLALPVNAPVPVTSQAAGGTGGFLSMQQGAPLPGWSLRLRESPRNLITPPSLSGTTGPLCRITPFSPLSAAIPVRTSPCSHLRPYPLPEPEGLSPLAPVAGILPESNPEGQIQFP